MQRADIPADRNFRQIQRPTRDLPVVHLEADIPPCGKWQVGLDGLVESPRSWDLADIRSLPCEEREWDLNCVWGWVRPSCRWEGVAASKLLDACRPLPQARYVVAEAADGGSQAGPAMRYASCLSLEEARGSLLAWKLDGRDLSPEHGGPLRLVPPPHKWGYKGVKWLSRITVVDTFMPGFWEEMVGDPVGDIPLERMDYLFE